jgi:hypothetical protein
MTGISSGAKNAIPVGYFKPEIIGYRYEHANCHPSCIFFIFS